jgi:hypothetical protein
MLTMGGFLKAASAAALVAGGWYGGAALSGSDNRSVPAATERAIPRPVPTTERTTTTRRPTTTVPPTTTTVPPTTTTWLPPQDSENHGSAEAYEPGPMCDAECTQDLICGYDGCTDPTGGQTVSTLAPPPCRVSTYHACDPEEPMELPVYGCEYLEQDYAGNVRCAD